MAALGVRLIVSASGQGAGGGTAPSGGATASSSSAPAPHSAPARGAVSPGSSAPVTGGTTEDTLVARLTDPRAVGPGLLVLAGSLITLVAARWIRSERDRKEYRRHYSASWG
jgi:hypothetical protein